MRKNRIYAYNSHYEICDYNLGDFKKLEDLLTFHDYPNFEHIPKYYYDENERKLYIPGGIDEFMLEEWNGKPVTTVDSLSNEIPIYFGMKLEPRNDDQRKAIRYLTGEDEFKSIRNDSQRVLIMPPGFGKTYCAVAAIQKLRTRSLIIMHTKTLKSQWTERIKDYTTMGGPNIVEIKTSEQLHGYVKNPPDENNMIFITTRRLLIFYCEKYGIHALDEVLNIMGIGIKIFDEAHKEYAATFFIDYITNVRKTFYLTATFKLSNAYDDKVFQASYNMVRKIQFKQSSDTRHIIYLAVLFNSYPNAIDEHKIVGRKRGFDRYRYIEYEINKGILENEVRNIIQFFLKDKQLDGKTLLLSSMKSTCEHFKNVAKSEMGKGTSVCSFYTDNKVDNYKDYDIISATASMLGTGEDIPGLRFLINTEPMASLTNTDQISGRLRPYDGGTKPTYYIEFIDIGFPKLYDWYRKRWKLLKRKVKECHEINRTIRL